MKTVRVAGRSIPILLVGVLVLLVLVGLSAGGVGIWRGWLRYHYYPKNWGVVEPGRIYRSGLIECGLVRKTLAEHDIGVVVTLNGWDPADPKQVALDEAARELRVEILRFPMGGGGVPGDGGIGPYAGAIAAVRQARNEGRPVLIQCSAGAYRTGGIVAAYQLLVQGKGPEEVYQHLCRHKWDPDNPKLLNYLNSNMTKLARTLVEMGVIDRAPDRIPVLGPA